MFPRPTSQVSDPPRGAPAHCASATPTLHLTCDLDLKSSNSDASIDLVAEKFGISRAEAADNICGHCETAAVAFTGALCVSVTC